MKTKIFNVAILFAITIMLFISCKGINSENKDVKTLYPLEWKKISDFSNLIDSIKIVDLEAKDSAYIVSINKMLVTKNKDIVILAKNGILVFDQTGKYKFKIGGRGDAPGEYISIYDICITQSGDYLLAVNSKDQILKYDLKNGDFVVESKITWGSPRPKVEAIAPGIKEGMFLFRANPLDVNSFRKDHRGRNFACLLEFDSFSTERLRSEQLNRYIERTDFNLNIDHISQTEGNNYFIRPVSGSETIYKVEEGKLKSFYDVDFEDKTIPLKYIYRNHDNAWDGLQDYIRSPYYKMPIYIEDTEDFLYFSAIAPQGKEASFLYNKKDEKKSVSWEDNFDKYPLRFRNAQDGYFYVIFDDYSDYEKNKDTWSPLKKYLIEDCGIKLAEKDNFKIVKIKFK